MVVIVRFIVSVILFTSLGCSSSLFDGNKPDSRVVELTANNIFSRNCAGIDLSGALIDVRTARTLVSCLNENGAIKEFDVLFAALNDEQVGALVNVINKGIISNKTRLKALDLSFRDLENQGVLNPIFESLGHVLSNKRFINAVIKFLSDLSTEPAPPGQKARINPQIIKALASLGPELSRDNMAAVLDVANVVGQSRALKKIGENIAQNDRDPEELRAVTDQLGTYFIESARRYDRNHGKTLLSAAGEGSLFHAFDLFFDYYSPAFEPHPEDSRRFGIDYQVANVQQFLDVLAGKAAENEAVLPQLAGLFSSLSEPVECLEDPYRIPSGTMWMIDQITRDSMDPRQVGRFLTRRAMLTLVAVNSMCTFPESLGTNSRALFRLAQTGGAQTAATLLKSMRYVEDETMKPLTRSVVGVLSDPRVTLLAPALRYFSQRLTLSDAIYLMNVLKPDSERTYVSHGIQKLLEPRDLLEGKSVYDVLVERAARLQVNDASLNNYFEIADSFLDYFDPYRYPQELLKPVAIFGHKALHINNISPLIELLQEVAVDAEKDRRFFETLFEASELPEFQGALDLFARMAKDGSLRQFIGMLLDIFRRNVEGVQVEYALNPAIPEPAKPEPVRDRSTAEMPLRPFFKPETFTNGVSRDGLGCATLDVGLLLSETRSEEWNRQMRSIAACVNIDGHGAYGDFVNFIEYGLSRRVPDCSASQHRGDRSLLEFFVDQGKDLFPKVDQSVVRRLYGWGQATRAAALRELGDFLEYNLEDAQRLLHFVQLLIGRRPGLSPDVSIAEESLKLFPEVMAYQPEVERGLAWAGRVAESPAVPRVAGYLGRTVFADDQVPDDYDEVSLPTRAQVEAALNDIEGRRPGLMKDRIDAVYESYRKQVRNDRLLMAYTSFDDYKKEVWKFLSALGRRNVLEWAFTYFQKFDGAPYSAEWWAGWYKRLSTRYSLIPYYYPGSDKPTLRLVNDLDRLELIVINANFAMKDYCSPEGFILCLHQNNDHNFALRYLTYLASAGEDLWPAIESMEGDLGYYTAVLNNPVLALTIPGPVKNRIRNLQHVLPAMRQVYTGYGTGADRKRGPNDLRVLADLFRAVYAGTPEQHREVYQGDKNSLQAIVELCHLGMLRNTGRILQRVSRDHAKAKVVTGPALTGLLRNFIEPSIVRKGNGRYETNAETQRLISFLVRNPKGKDLTNKMLQLFYGWSERSDDRALATRAGFHLLSLLGDMGRQRVAETELTIAQALVRFITPIILNHSETLGEGIDLIEVLALRNNVADWVQRMSHDSQHDRFSSEDFNKLSDLIGIGLREGLRLNLHQDVKTWIESMYLKRHCRNTFRRISDAWNNLTQDPEYHSCHGEELLERFLAWFERQGPLATRLHYFTAERIKEGDVLSLMTFTSCGTNPSGCYKPRELYQQLQILGRPERRRELQDFMEFLHDAMVYNP